MRFSLWGRVTAVVAGAAFSLFAAGVAHAEEVTLNPDHVGVKAADFQQECTGPFADLPEGQDGWHFVLPSASGDDFISVSPTFDSGVSITITSTDPNNPSSGPGWSGYLDNAGMDTKHAYLFTTAGWTLTGGTAQVADGGQHEFFNLSHTCAGTPPTTPPTTTTPPQVTKTPSGGVPAGGGGTVGTTHVAVLAGGLVLLVALIAGVVFARRRTASRP